MSQHHPKHYFEGVRWLNNTYCPGIGRGHRVSPAGQPIEQVLDEYSLS